MANRHDFHDDAPRNRGRETRDAGRDRPDSRKGRQKSSQRHAEGEHGAKTHARFIEQLHERRHEEPVRELRERVRDASAYAGKRRLVEDRQQHDEGEKNSERTRLFVEHKRGRDRGPSDNSGNLHGVLGHREHRADYKRRGSDGLEVK